MQVRDCDFIDVAPGAVAVAQMVQSKKSYLSAQVRSTEIQHHPSSQIARLSMSRPVIGRVPPHTSVRSRHHLITSPPTCLRSASLRPGRSRTCRSF
eukprot:261004-Prorocentrum_minimum.AAC.1